MNINLRILTTFLEIIKQEDQQEEIISFILNRLNKSIESHAKDRKEKGLRERYPNKDELKKMSKIIFWNTNFLVVYGLIDKIINSIGSNKCNPSRGLENNFL